MNIWEIYYEAYQQRQTRLDEARQYRLINAFLNIKESRFKKSPFRFQSKQIVNNQALSLGNK